MSSAERAERATGSDTHHWNDSRWWRALTMVAVAFIGASLAYFTGKYELQSVRLEREIVQQNLISVTERQRLLDFVEARDQLRRRADVYRALAESNAAAATDHARSNAEQAEILMLQAQEEFAAARALKPFIDVTSRVVNADGPDTDTNVRRSVDRFKEARGMASEPDSLAKLDDAMEEAHEKVRTLAGAVVIFILSLVMFTLSDIYRSTPYRSRTWFATGIVIAVLGTAFAMYTNHDLRIGLGIGVAVLLAFAAMTWIMGSRHARREAATSIERQGEPGGTEAHFDRHHREDPHPDIKPEEHRFLAFFTHAQTPYSRRIIYVMAIAVLLSAVFGFRYTWALIESTTAAHQALKQQIDLNNNVTADAEAIDTLLQVADAAEARARSQVLRYKAAYLTSKHRGDEALAAAARADALDASARNPIASQWLEHPMLGADADAGFPRKLLNQWSVQGGKADRWESLAMWDAHNDDSVHWNHLATQLLWTLTVVAIALYLLGHANAMGKSAAGWTLMAAGCGFLVMAIGVAVRAEALNVQRESAPETEDCRSDPSHSSAALSPQLRAARYYASARALLMTADSAEKYHAAVTALGCMSKLRGDESTLPRVDYVRALELESTFQTNQPYAGLPPKEDIQEMTKRMNAVVDQYTRKRQQPPARILASLGRYSLLQALDGGDRKELERAVSILGEAAEASRPISEDREAQRRRILVDLAIAQYALGDEQKGDITANAAIALAGKRVVARTLTDLEILRSYCGSVRSPQDCESLARRIDGLKSKIVATTWQEPNALPAVFARSDDTTAAVREMTIDVAPDGLRWSLSSPLRVAAQQQLALVWYEFDSDWDVWRAMWGVSGLVSPEKPVVSYLEATRLERCIATDAGTQYRAELYLDGRLVARATDTLAPGRHFRPWLLSDLNIALCAPAGWTEIDVPHRSDSDAMLVRVIGTDSGAPAVAFFTFYGFNRNDAGSQQMERVVRYLARRGWIDAQTTMPVPRDRSGSCAKAGNDGLPSYVTFTTSEGVRHVAVALRGAGSAKEACIVLRSVTNRYATRAFGVPKATAGAAIAAR